MGQRVAEGRELAIESKKANLAVLRANQHADGLAEDMTDGGEQSGRRARLRAGELARPAAEERAPLVVPVSEEASIEKALEGSNELKRLQSNIQSKMLEIKSYHAERLPKVNLVAQYSLFAKYNYQDYFAKFQRNNAQVELPSKFRCWWAGRDRRNPRRARRTSPSCASNWTGRARASLRILESRTKICGGPKRREMLHGRIWISRARN